VQGQVLILTGQLLLEALFSAPPQHLGWWLGHRSK